MKPSQKKAYKVCVCAIIKDEFPYLLEWIAYHRVIGIDYFFIYDNESTDGSTELLEKLDKAGILKHIKFPDTTDKVTQHAAYNDCLQQARNITEWIAFIDADEFILPHKHQNLKTFLEDYSNVDAIAINWKIFGSSSKRYRENSLLMERFTKCSTRDFHPNGHIKTIAKIDDIDHVGTHTCVFKSKESKKYIYPDKNPIPKVKFTGLGRYINHDIIQINHYFTKSLEEWNFKRVRGRADMHRDNPKKIRDMSAFEGMDENVAEDLKILNFLQQTKNEIEVLKSLAKLSQIEDKLEGARKVYEQKLIDNNRELFVVTSCQEFENGNHLIDLGEVERAIAAYKCAIKFNSDYALSHYKLGKALLKKGENNTALNCFQQATQIYKKQLNFLKSKIATLTETNTNKKLVHCILLTFYFNEVLERCLAGLLPEKDRIDVTVVENSSVHSNAMRKVVESYKEKGLVKNHFIFDKNIGTNAFEIAFDSNLLDLDYEYIIVTDGDLVPDKGWLDEQITILEKCPEVFSVSSELHLGNAGARLRHNILQIQNNAKLKNNLYKDRNAGWVIKTFRASDWKDFLAFRKKNNIYFHDCSVHYYANAKRNMCSATTIKSKCYHLTWDYVDNKYDQLKKSLMAETNNPWYHNKYSAFRFINDCKEELLFSQPPEVFHQYADSMK